MKILIIHQYLWTHYKAVIYSELQRLCIENSKDNELLVLQMALNEKSRSNLGTIDLTIHNYNYKLISDTFIEDSGLLSRTFKMIREFLKFNPDVVNISGYYEPSMLMVYFLAKLFGKKVIISNDSTEDDNHKNWLKSKLKNFILNSANGFFCYGTKSSNLIKNHGISEKLILSQINAVPNSEIRNVFYESQPNKDLQKINLNLPTYNFIYIGRLLKIKNIKLLIESFAEIKNEDWGLIILGEGEEEIYLKEMVLSGNISNITFLPGVSWRKIPEILSLADVFILPSFSEPWGLVVNEAMVCEMPVIVSNKCGCAIDLVDASNGIVFDPSNKIEMVDSMKFFIENPSKIKEFGQASSKKIKKYSPENVALEMFEGFKNVLAL